MSTQRGKNTGLHQSPEKSDIYCITVAGGVYNSGSKVSSFLILLSGQHKHIPANLNRVGVD